MKINLGTSRIYLSRLRSDASLANTIILIYLAFKAGYELAWWHIPVIIVLVLFRLWLDSDRVIRQEQDYLFRKSELFMDMKNKIDELYKGR